MPGQGRCRQDVLRKIGHDLLDSQKQSERQQGIGRASYGGNGNGGTSNANREPATENQEGVGRLLAGNRAKCGKGNRRNATGQRRAGQRAQKNRQGVLPCLLNPRGLP